MEKSKTILSATNIRKSYEGVDTIRNTNLNLQQGENISLVGVSGVGKTTLFNVLSGLYIPDEGEVLLEGEDITGQAGHISYMLQKDLLLPYRTILDNVALPLIIKGIPKAEARERAKVHFAAFGLSGFERKYPFQLSGGMRQRAALLRTYLFSGKVALLDEPFSALDAITKKEIHQWFLDVMKHIDLSVVFITHDIDEAILLSDRVLVMSGKPGEIVAEVVINKNGYQSMNDFSLSEKFLAYKRQLLALIK